MQPKHNAIVYFVGSVLLIFVAIVFISILNSVKIGVSSDSRIRAGSANTVKMSAVVSSADETQGVLIVDNLQFRTGLKKDLGSWTVTPPSDYSLSRATPGKKITLTVDPTTFIAATHTLTALSVK